MNEFVLVVKEKDEFLMNPNPGFIKELDFTVKEILNTEESEFFEAKTNNFIHYQLNGKEVTKYFGYLIDNNFYWSSYPIAFIEQGKIKINNPSIIMEDLNTLFN